MNLLETIDKLNKIQHENRTARKCGDSTMIKETDVVGYSEKGKRWLYPQKPERLGWCVGFPNDQTLIKVHWWFLKTSDTYHKSYIKKVSNFKN